MIQETDINIEEIRAKIRNYLTPVTNVKALVGHVLQTRRNLTTKEFEVLELLIMNPGKVYSRDSLLQIIWGEDYPGDVRTVDVHIRRLREKIENNPSEPKYVQTKWGLGYFFKG